MGPGMRKAAGVLGLVVFLTIGLLACGKKGAQTDPSTGAEVGQPARAPEGTESGAQGADVNDALQDTVSEDTVVNVSECITALDATCRTNGMAVMADGSFLVTDLYNKVIWRVKDGSCTVFAGSETVQDLYGEPIGGYNDDMKEKSFFSSPWAVAPFLDGWAVSDAENDAIRLISGGKVLTINGRSEEKLIVGKLGVIFDYPTGLAADGEGNLYVADTHNGAVRKISSQGIVSTVAKGLKGPTGLCWRDGILYIAETDANRILKCVNGKTEPLAGCGDQDYIDGKAAKAAFAYPQGVAVGDDGTIYIADTGNSAVRMIRDGEVTTLLSRDRTSLELEPVSPVGLLVQEDELYVCDSFTGKVLRVRLREESLP